MLKIAKFFGKTAWELGSGNIGGIIAWVAGSGLLFYLGSLTEWAAWLGPFGWALFAIAAMSLAFLSYAAWVLASQKLWHKSLAEAKASAGAVNVLAPSHDHERINLSEFYSPFFFTTKNVIFTDCDLYGPSNAAIFGGTFNGCSFFDCEIVIVREDRPIKGATAFEHCTFLRGKLVRLTLLMNLETYQKLPDPMKKQIPVISDGRIGDI